MKIASALTRDVVVVGSYIQDSCFRSNFFPSIGETRVSDFQCGPGGKGFNQAVSAHRAGALVTFIGAIGNDSLKKEAIDFSKKENIDCFFVTIDGEQTGRSGIFVEGVSGENITCVFPGANSKLDESVVRSCEDIFNGRGVVLCQLECNLGSVKEALRLGKENGRINILNTAPINEDFEFETLQNVDILISNESEFKWLISRLNEKCSCDSRVSDIKKSQYMIHELCRLLNVPTVIVTLGENGCFVSTESSYFLVHALDDDDMDDPVVDTTGAGDAFCGCFSAELSRSGNLRNSVEFAIVGAGLCARKIGTTTVMPRLDEIRKHM